MGSILNKIKATTGLKTYEGKLSIGLLFENDPKWHNIYGESEALQELKKILAKGNTISYDFFDGNIVNISLIEKAQEAKNTQKSDQWQDEIVDFETLMTEAHNKGLISINTEMLEVNLEKKYALFRAIVIGKIEIKGKTLEGTFTGHGDATEENITGAFIKPHFIRMAETRAIVRALRWYTNNAGHAAEEEK